MSIEDISLVIEGVLADFSPALDVLSGAREPEELSQDEKELRPSSNAVRTSEEDITLDADSIMLIHDTMVKTHGGEYGVRDNGLLESIGIAPYTEYFGTKLYPTVYDQAAKTLFDFANYQVFVDGNKRTGLASALVLLRLNGINLDITNEQAYTLVLDIANHGYNESSELVEFIKRASSFDVK